jgi:cytochrome c
MRVAACLGAVMMAGLAIHGQGPATRRSVRDGVFSERQVDRGRRVYLRSCEHCHGSSLEGNDTAEIPALVYDSFFRQWNGRTVADLFEHLRRSMPADDRGSLTPRATADMIAYLLRINGVAAGQTPLPSDREALAALIIDEKPSGAPTP